MRTTRTGRSQATGGHRRARHHTRSDRRPLGRDGAPAGTVGRGDDNLTMRYHENQLWEAADGYLDLLENVHRMGAERHPDTPAP